MADTASLIARVKTDGADTAAKQLDDFANKAEKADKASDNLGSTTQKASPKLKGFGTGAQQVGYQVQDMIVQIQGGTSAFVALGQQGSQLAGAFGPGGAVLGAIIALGAAAGGTLYKAFGDAGASAGELADAAKDVGDVLTLTEQGVYEVSDAFRTYVASGASAAEINARVSQSLVGLNVQLDEVKRKLREAGSQIKDTSFLTSLSVGGLAAAGGLSATNLELQASAERLGITADEWKSLNAAQQEFIKQPTEDKAKNLSRLSGELASKYKDQNTVLRDYNNSIQDNTYQYEQNTKAQAKLRTAREDDAKAQAKANDDYVRGLEVRNLKDKEAAAARLQTQKEAIAAREGLDDDQRKRANAAAQKQYDMEIAAIDKRESDKTARITAAEQRRADSAAKSADRVAAQQKQQASGFLDLIARQNQDEIKAIDAQEQQKLEKLATFNQQGLIVGQEYEQARTQIMLDADAARQEELDKRKKDRQAKEQKGDEFIAQIQGQNATELELFDIQQKQKEEVAKKYRDDGLISEQEYQQSLLAIAGNYNKKRSTEYSSMLGETTDNLKAALGEGNKMYKAFAIANAIMNTYQGAVAAFQSAAAIPIVGWVAAPAAAAAAVAAGLANVAKIRSAREQGGNLAAGQASIVGERNRAEVIVPAGASRVRTMQQIQQMAGQQNQAPTEVQIVNQTTGRIDSATTEQTDENKLRIIIRETVSADMADSNSGISKTRRATRGQPGF